VHSHTSGKLHNLIELPRNLVCSPPDSQSPAGLPAAPVDLHRPRCCARWANLRLLVLQASQPFGSRPVNSGWNPAPRAISAPTRPRIVIDPASGLISPFSIFNSVMLIPAFPRRLTLWAAFGSLPERQPRRLGPSPIMPNQPQTFPPAQLKRNILKSIDPVRRRSLRSNE